MLGGGDGIAAGRVHDDDSLCGRRIEIDVIHTDPGPRNHAQLGRRRQQFRIGLGRTADNHGMCVGDGGQCVFPAHFARRSHLQAVYTRQNVKRGLVNAVWNQYVVGHAYTPRNSSMPASTSSSVAGCKSPMCAMRKVLPLILP